MCVVDRRNNKKAGHGSKFGKSMAELRAEEEKLGTSKTAGGEQPARIQVDEREEKDKMEEDEKGVNVVVGTPGSEALVERMLSDIWGA